MNALAGYIPPAALTIDLVNCIQLTNTIFKNLHLKLLTSLENINFSFLFISYKQKILFCNYNIH